MAVEHSPEEMLETLVEEDVVTVDPETDLVSTTDEFESHRSVYYDTYLTMPDAEFHESVADVFGLPSAEAAAERVAELEVSREEFATFLTLRSRLEGYDQSELTVMAQLATEAGPSTPVPDGVEHLDDDTWAEFVDRDRAIVTVWKMFCDPCEAMKDELDDVLATFDGIPVGGVDGEQCPEFCRSVGVNAAPGFVFFEDGEPIEIVTGRTDPDALAARADEVYGR
ncbi:thioredoxin family protein [Halomicroarcula sp. F13]|uniref:Thioredoxin family protein n=1 Tax=Haloarcula rubra TaxID=2487747 RepID=A0AAW4PV37_9EURY|nr:thioredoxin family protein [Halomicroarcula rubra]MBX0324127.1 thioredoxin family protein [Halomicroarcula rubra]